VPATAGNTSQPATRVLVVEDDRTSRAALVGLLRIIGFDPLPAASVAEGLRLLEKRPHCLILDLMLPDGNGSDILAHVRKHNIPALVVVTTGALEFQTALSPPNATPDAIFPKPLDFNRLSEWLNVNVGPASAKGETQT